MLNAGGRGGWVVVNRTASVDTTICGETIILDVLVACGLSLPTEEVLKMALRRIRQYRMLGKGYQHLLMMIQTYKHQSALSLRNLVTPKQHTMWHNSSVTPASFLNNSKR
mmetsp:Transcript_8484/g.19049  ORF Transcript_8484/g.19049 Transcript_8484/m.19049 type:complete len:110 (-) Transcript_8484:1294-1623(-)